MTKITLTFKKYWLHDYITRQINCDVDQRLTTKIWGVIYDEPPCHHDGEIPRILQILLHQFQEVHLDTRGP